MKTIIKSLLFLMLFAVSEAASAIGVVIQNKDVTILNITSTTATITWQKAVRTDGVHAPLYYRVIWQERTSGIGLQLQMPKVYSPFMADTDTYTMRKGMIGNETYDVWIEVYDTYAGKEYLNYKSFSFTTKKSSEVFPEITPDYMYVPTATLKNNSAQVYVMSATDTETAKEDIVYSILYKKSGETAYKQHSCKGKITNSTQTKFVIDGLERNTSYDIIPIATNKRGNSTFYDVQNIKTTDKDEASPVVSSTKVDVSEITSNGATITWQAASDDVTPQSKLLYDVSVSLDGGGIFKQVDVTGSTALEVTGLAPSTKYRVNITVYDETYNRAHYEAAYFTTKAEEKAYPIKVAGIDVKGSNRNDILGDGGSVKYDPTSNVLTLNNVVVPESKFSGDFIYVDHSGLTIKLIGNNELESSIYAYTDEDIVFTGNGTLTVKSKTTTFYSFGGIRLEGGCTVGFYALGAANDAIHMRGDITVDNSTLKAKGRSGAKGGVSISGCTGVNLIGTDYLSMHYYEKSTGMFIDGQFDEAHDEIIIGPKAPDTTAPTVSNKTYIVENVTEHGFTIRWEKATDDVTPASDIEYTIGFVKASEYTGYSWPIAASKLYDVDSYTFTNLESGETYLVIVWAYDAAGNKVEYERKEITTLSLDQNAPFVPNKELTITDVTSDGFTVNWTPAEDDVTPADALVYDVYIAEVPDDDIYEYSCYATLVGATSCTITGLDPEKAYVIAVSVMDAWGNFGGYNDLYSVVINNLTPVESIKADKVMNNGKMYNSAGVEVGNDYRGIVFINGKKYFKNK